MRGTARRGIPRLTFHGGTTMTRVRTLLLAIAGLAGVGGAYFAGTQSRGPALAVQAVGVSTAAFCSITLSSEAKLAANEATPSVSSAVVMLES